MSENGADSGEAKRYIDRVFSFIWIVKGKIEVFLFQAW